MAKLSKGDTVTWNTPQGETHGTVVATHDKPFTLDGKEYGANDDEQYVVVESDKSGKQAAHKAGSVTKK